MLRRLLAHARRAVAALGRAPAAVACVAALATAAMYCGNTNVDPDPAAARGDGRYRPLLARGDGHMHFLITRSLVFDRDVDLDNDLARFGDPWNQPRTVTGRKNVMQQVGPSLIWAPVLAGAHVLALAANVAGADIPTHGYTLFHQRVVFATSVLFGWLAVGLGLYAARRLAGGRWGPTLAAVAVLLGSALTYFATFQASYAHAMDAAVVAGFLALWACTFGEDRLRRYVGLGALLGVAALVRAQNFAFGAVLVVELAPVAWRRLRQRDVRGALGPVAAGGLVLAVAVLVFVPQMLVWKQWFGAYLTTPQGPGQMRYAHPMVLELLFSSNNGWLSTHPIAYAGTLGLGVGVIWGPRLGPKVRAVCIALLVVVAGQVYINACVYDWWAGASLGQRRMCSSTLPLVVGLAVLLRAAHLALRMRARAKLAIAFVTLGYFVAWNLGWVVQLSHGRSAGRQDAASCCDDVPRPLAWLGEPVYAVVGNPFELPASAYFAVVHGVSLQRWDIVNGKYVLAPPFIGYIDGSYRRARALWNVPHEGMEPYLLGGWGPPQGDTAKLWRWTTAERATVLLPLLMPEPHRITMPIIANVRAGDTLDVTVLENGRPIASSVIGPTWTTLVFDTDGRVGDNEITIEAPVHPYRLLDVPSAPAMPGPMPVGVAIGTWRVALPP